MGSKFKLQSHRNVARPRHTFTALAPPLMMTIIIKLSHLRLLLLLPVLSGLSDPDAKRKYIVSLLNSLPEPNKSTMNYVINHILRFVTLGCMW